MLIKLFEEYNDDQFIEISSNDLRDILNNNSGKLITFIENEKSNLSNYGKISINTDNSISLCLDLNEHSYVDIRIYKMPDEWYYVMAIDDYKCDEFTGLIRCLNYIIKKLN